MLYATPFLHFSTLIINRQIEKGKLIMLEVELNLGLPKHRITKQQLNPMLKLIILVIVYNVQFFIFQLKRNTIFVKKLLNCY